MKSLVGREGIEPPQSKTADLQSAELTTCSTYPREGTRRERCGRCGGPNAIEFWQLCSVGADDGTRTRNRRFTKPLLYQLSYVGAQGHTAEQPRRRRMIGPTAGGVKRARRPPRRVSDRLEAGRPGRSERPPRTSSAIASMGPSGRAVRRRPPDPSARRSRSKRRSGASMDASTERPTRPRVRRWPSIPGPGPQPA
jgi:hypothetical protein